MWFMHHSFSSSSFLLLSSRSKKFITVDKHIKIDPITEQKSGVLLKMKQSYKYPQNVPVA